MIHEFRKINFVKAMFSVDIDKTVSMTNRSERKKET
jgi:hypothetical protein